MNLEEYKIFVMDRMSSNLKMDITEYASCKFISECGELLGELVKHEAHGKELDLQNVLEELGDILFYSLVLQENKNTYSVFFRTITSSEVLRSTKDVLMFALDAFFSKNFIEIGSILQYAEKDFNFTLEMIIDANIAKLNKRGRAEQFYMKSDTLGEAFKRNNSVSMNYIDLISKSMKEPEINIDNNKVDNPFETQIDGNHYTKLSVQPFEYSMKNGLNPLQHTIIKYITRYKDKGGKSDLLKAKHCIDMLIEFEYKEK